MAHILLQACPRCDSLGKLTGANVNASLLSHPFQALTRCRSRVPTSLHPGEEVQAAAVLQRAAEARLSCCRVYLCSH